MSTIVAAMRGKLGNTEYFVISMKAGELADKAKIPSELDEWADMSLEERFQRDLNHARVKNQIVPYLADPGNDRFFGSLIMMAKNFDPSSFEPIEKIALKGLPNAYTVTARPMGFLTFHGGEVLIPLDGQHRLRAIKFAIEGKDDKGKKISGISPCLDLANEDVTVILVACEIKESRKIFTAVNKYAKKTTKAENLIVDDNDIVAVLSRQIANDKKIIGARLVKYDGDALVPKDEHFTTLTTLAVCNLAILQYNFPEKIDTKSLPDKNKTKLYTDKVNKVWKFLVGNIDWFSDLLKDKTKKGDAKRREIRKRYLIGKPVPQACLVKAFAKLTTSGKSITTGKKFTYTEAAKTLNAIEWKNDAPEWDRLFLIGNRIQTKNSGLVVDIICYCADWGFGDKRDAEHEAELLKRYRSLFSHEKQAEKQLPFLLKLPLLK